MNVRQIINQLKSMGYEVSFFVRKDGGVRITKIDSVRFTGSQGNTYARTIVGAQLSERRAQQLEGIRTAKGTWGHYKKSEVLPEDLLRKVRSVQRLFRTHKVQTKTGTISIKNVRWVYKHEGYEEAMRRLNQASKYARGIAYDENIDALIERLEQQIPSCDDNEIIVINEIIELIKKKKESGNFTEDMLSNILNPWGKLYQWLERRLGVSIEDVRDDIKKILKL